MSSKRRILVVQEQSLIACLIAEVLANHGFEAQWATTTPEALKIAETFDPDLLLTEIVLQDGTSGIALSLALLAINPGLSLVFLTNVPEPRLIGIDNKSISKKAAYLCKAWVSEPSAFLNAIEAVFRSQDISKYRNHLQHQDRYKQLSKTQLELMRLVALGFSNEEIAAQRGTTLRATQRLLQRTLDALGIDSSTRDAGRVRSTLEYLRVSGHYVLPPQAPEA